MEVGGNEAKWVPHKTRGSSCLRKDVSSPNEVALQVEVDCSKLDWDSYRNLIMELEDLLAGIDEKHSVISKFLRGRSLRARYTRVTADERRRKLRLTPFPSHYSNVLTNTRAYVYELVNRHCITLERIGNRCIFLLPKPMALPFLEAVESLNEVIKELRERIKDFRDSDDYFTIKACLYKHGVDPTVLDTSPFIIRDYTVDVIPIDLGYSVDEDEFYKGAKAVRGLEILRNQIERRLKEYSINAVKDIIGKVMLMAEDFDRMGRLRLFKARVGKLIELCSSVGMDEIVERLKVVEEALKITSKAKRAAFLKEKFGTSSVKEALSKFSA